MPTPLSSVQAQTKVDEFLSNVDLDKITNAELIQAMNSAQRELATTLKANGQQDYIDTTVGVPIGVTLGGGGAVTDERRGTGVATPGGTLITFSSAFSPWNPTNLNYVLIFLGAVDYINPVTQVDTRTASGFTAYSAVGNVPFFYIAGKLL